MTHIEKVKLPYLAGEAWWATLDNGHMIIAVPKPGEVTHLHTVVRTGSVNENNSNTGVSHFLEHLMFKGSARFPAGEFDRLLEGVGGRVNASTSKDYTQYFVTLPSGRNNELYHLALDLHADMLLHANLPDTEIGPAFDIKDPQVTEKRERMVVIEEIKMGKDNPWRRTLSRMSELLYPTHPYRREVIGTAEVIASIPREKIVEYYQSWYQPGNMVTIVSGEHDPETVINEVAQAFAFEGERPVVHPVFDAELPPAAPRTERLKQQLNVAYAALGFLGPSATNIRDTIALDVIGIILGGGPSSRLHQRLIEKLPDTPFIDVGSTQWEYRDSSNILAFAIAHPNAAGRALELLHNEVLNLHDEPITAAELATTITRLEASFAAQTETAEGIASGLADSIARLNSPIYYTEYLPTLHTLTLEYLAATISNYLAPDKICAVTIGPE